MLPVIYDAVNSMSVAEYVMLFISYCIGENNKPHICICVCILLVNVISCHVINVSTFHLF